MYLKKLELHGFKSFAQNTALEFQRGVSAVVGPNGSGKSNIADAIRFVLGEQSMKNVRSKKGEDLIFSGSADKSRLNIASVAIHFDNQDKIFPLDFETVIIKRKIFRDGENQYYINDSQTRLKDVAELIARARLGLRGYAVISQGMGDAILSASAKDRKEIISDALGLREFQIKRLDATAKLAQTKTNMESAQAVLKELVPHLRFLKKQAEKMEERDDLRLKLSDLEKRWLRKKTLALDNILNKLQTEAGKQKALVESASRDLETTTTTLEEENKKILQSFADIPKMEESLFKIESERNGMEREIGKIEGMIAFARESSAAAEYQSIDLSYVKERFERLNVLFDEVLRQETYESIRGKLDDFKKQFSEILNSIREGKVSTQKIDQPRVADLAGQEKKRGSLLAVLAESDQKLKSIKDEIRNINTTHSKEKEHIFELKNSRRELESCLSSANEKYAELDREMEKYRREKQVLDKEKERLKEGGNESDMAEADLLSLNDDEMIRDIERLKIKLENIDLIDQSVKAEYEETQKRHDFLSKELGDLEAAISSLTAVIAELDTTIAARFKTAFKTINDNFNSYFKLLFEGGWANLEIASSQKSPEDAETAPEDKPDSEEYGVEIEVSLPHKKTSGLSMLSGGERALTSLALLFALVSTSPPPFLVLDEIDAPLDEANSLRFAKIIGELKNHTQFIIITHNRETMRQSDVLFGVTMQEDGVSKLLSLKLSDVEVLTESGK